MDQQTLAVCAGSALLVVVAALPAAGRLRAITALGVAVGFLVLTAAGIRWQVREQRYVPKSHPMRIARYGVERLKAASRRPPDNLVVVEGGSYASRAVHPLLLRRTLKKLGYRAEVVQVSLSAANHFERFQLQDDILRYSGFLQQPRKRQHVVLLSEVQYNYDRTPLAQFMENLDTDRTYYYVSPATVWFGLRALYSEGVRSEEVSLWELLRHGMVNGFNVGISSRFGPWRRNTALTGHQRNTARRRGEVKNLRRLIAAATRPLTETTPLPWLWSIREARLRDLWGGSLDEWVSYGIPTRQPNYIEWTREYCKGSSEPCIAVDDPALLEALGKGSKWYDWGHLSSQGAEIYTKWLAGRLVATGVLVKR